MLLQLFFPRLWCVGVVLDIKYGNCLVHYVGWSRKWNEWLSICGTRMRALGAYTSHSKPPRAKLITVSKRLLDEGLDARKYMNCLRATYDAN